MLVLSRKLGQQIVVDHHVVVTVLRIQGDRVRLGIEAPLSVPVRREELRAYVAGERQRVFGVPVSD